MKNGLGAPSLCVKCPAGYWSEGTKCRNCKTVGVASCSEISGNATSCLSGYGFYPNEVQGKQCLKCIDGQFSDGSYSCRECDGYYPGGPILECDHLGSPSLCKTG